MTGFFTRRQGTKKQIKKKKKKTRGRSPLNNRSRAWSDVYISQGISRIPGNTKICEKNGADCPLVITDKV